MFSKQILDEVIEPDVIDDLCDVLVCHVVRKTSRRPWLTATRRPWLYTVAYPTVVAVLAGASAVATVPTGAGRASNIQACH